MALTTEAVVTAPGQAAELMPTSRRWKRSLAVGVPAGLIGLIVFACYILPLVAPIPAPIGGSAMDSLQPNFSPGHLLGTDFNGNDIFSRILHGGRTSLFIALCVQVIGVVIGGGLGALAAQLGGIADSIIMRFMDVLIAVPSLILVIVISQALGPGLRNTIFALAFLSIPTFARIARAETLRLREQPFMVAAKLSGTSTWRILVRHLAPNIGPTVMTTALLGMGIVMIIEGALPFLGGGIEPPAPTWGNMIFSGYFSLSGMPWLVVWPSLALTFTVIGFNGLGEALRARWSSR